MEASTQTNIPQPQEIQEPLPPVPPHVVPDEMFDRLVQFVSELKNESSYWKGYLNGYRNGTQGQPNKAPPQYSNWRQGEQGATYQKPFNSYRPRAPQ